MRWLVLAAALVLTGCDPNRAELAAIQADYDAHLAVQMTVAQSLNDRRRHAEALRDWLESADPNRGAPPTIPPLPPSRPFVARPLPPPSVLDSEDSKRSRERIQATERRIRELERVLSEVYKLEEQRLAIEAKLPRTAAP